MPTTAGCVPLAMLLLVTATVVPVSAASRTGDQALPYRVAWATHTENAPTLDGVVTQEDGWDAAPALTCFTIWHNPDLEPDAKQGIKPAAPTEAWLLYDDDALYIAARLDGPGRGELDADATDRDGGVRSNDCLEIFLAPRHAPALHLATQYGRRYFNLTVNPIGTQRDAVGYQGVTWWNGEWTARTSIRDDGWTVEIRIPFATLGVEPGRFEAWGLNLCRRYSSAEGRRHAAWSPVDHWYNFPWHYGRLVFGKDRPQDDEIPCRFVQKQLGGELAPVTADLERALAILQSVPPSVDARTTMANRLAALKEDTRAVVHRVSALDRTTAPGALDTIGREIDGLEKQVHAVYRAVQVMCFRAEAPAAWPFAVLGGPAITHDRFAPGKPIPARFDTVGELAVTACRGEYEPVAFYLVSPEARRGVRVRVTDLTGPSGTLPAGIVDIHVIKYWYQSGVEGYWEQSTTGDWDRAADSVQLVGELLLKDDGLVVVDHAARKNFARIDDVLIDISDPARQFGAEGDPKADHPHLLDFAPKDADTLQPFDVTAEQVKHLHVTVHVPANATAGTYTGSIHLDAPGAGSLSLPLAVEVLPFDLAAAPIDYALYYQGRLRDDTPAVAVWSHFKTERQYRAEMENLLAHGIVSPTEPIDRFEWFVRNMGIRESVGMPKGHIYSLGQRFDRHDGVEQENSDVRPLQESVKPFVAWARENGYKSFYVYGLDEDDHLLPKEQRWMRAMHAVGAKVFVAVEDDAAFLHLADGLLDLPIMSGLANPRIAASTHAQGNRQGIYGWPQADREEPEKFRRRYGVRLWQAGYDVAMTYAYQHGFGHAWNDFDFGGRMDYMLTYPTVDGVIDTLPYEGLREAVDDSRYVATLIETAAKARQDPARNSEANEAVRWIRSASTDGDLDVLRQEIVKRILSLTR